MYELVIDSKNLLLHFFPFFPWILGKNFRIQETIQEAIGAATLFFETSNSFALYMKPKDSDEPLL